MKKIIAYIRKEKADTVIAKLEEAGVKGMTLIDANAIAEWADKEAFSYSIEYIQKYSRVVKIELVCNNKDAHKLVNVISFYVKTEVRANGWVFASPIEKQVNIK
ncbi:MAG: P-II family nitrogen regulator, partial [Bacteroidetes bacterium]|nr:P-II family nitrogen regulator [Bacteroidota bacterium]